MNEPDFEFSKAAIDEHIERIGVDIRPPIDISMEQVRIAEFYRKVNESHPDLFESLALGPQEFKIKKKFSFPPKGQAEMETFALTRRGPVFTIPRRLAILEGETDLPIMDEQVVDVLRTFRQFFPQSQILRIGKIHEYIFYCGQENSTEFVARRFTKLESPTEVFVRFNLQIDDYNRIFEIHPVARQRCTPTGQTDVAGFGVRVKIDFNNAHVSAPLSFERILDILADANRFNDREFFPILKGVGDE